MNSSILNIISLRIKNAHYNLDTGVTNARGETIPSIQEFPSINKAKAHSKKLGGAGKVRAFKDKADAYDFMRAYEAAKPLPSMLKANEENL